MADPVANSSTQMQLVNSPVFLARLQYFLLQQAAVVLNEAHNFAFHAGRLIYANSVLSNPTAAAIAAAPLIASSNVGGAVIVGTVVQWAAGPWINQWDSSATDTAINQAITNNFNALAKIDTGT